MNIILTDRADRQIAYRLDSEVKRQLGLFGRLRLFFARRRADAMLRRVLKPYRVSSAAQLSPHLLKDIGLPPDLPL